MLDQQEYLKRFKIYFFVERVLEKIAKDIKKVEKITDVEKRSNEARSCLNRHQDNLMYVTVYFSNGKLSEVGVNYDTTVCEYEKRVDKLKKIWQKARDEVDKIKKRTEAEKKKEEKEWKSSHCAKCGKKSTVWHYIYDKYTKKLEWSLDNANNPDQQWIFCTKEHFNEWKKNDCYTCLECNQEKLGGTYWYREKSNDGKKFCSEKCVDIYYAPTCDKCSKKCLNKNNKVASWYSDIEKKTGDLCYKCNDDRNKKEQELRKEWDKMWDDLGKEMRKEEPYVSWDEVDTPCSLKEFKEKKNNGQLENYLQEKLEEIQQVREDKKEDPPEIPDIPDDMPDIPDENPNEDDDPEKDKEKDDPERERERERETRITT
jgi:hypothetical protein